MRVELEPPYKLGERPDPATREAYLADIREQRHWNDGGLGTLAADPLPVEGHPDPRVIVNITSVRGGHDKKALEREARKNHWIQVVRCYRLGAYKDPELQGWTKARMTVSKSGRVTKPKLLETELADRAVAECMVDKLAALTLPRATRGSTVSLELRVGPGDEPMPPPTDLLVPGDGVLSVEAMRAGAARGLPRFEACYRAAFSYAPELWGRIAVRFHLTDKGVLDEAFEAGSRFPDARVAQCVLHAARELSFDKPQGGELRFVVPIRFASDRSHHAPAP